MKYTETTTKALKFKNGHLLLAVENGLYYIKTSDGIMIYSKNEMEELYQYS